MDTELIEIWRGDMRESVHRGHAVVCDASGQIVQAWGDPGVLVYPRSSAKMMQALPLAESGLSLTSEQLALSCASHNAAAIHTDRVQAWLGDMGLSDAALRCGPQPPGDITARDGLIKSDQSPCQYHNNCSGKHCGFLALNQHLGGGPEYLEIDHPVQVAVKQAFEEVTEADSPHWAIDGCSAPNHATTLAAFARGAAKFAAATDTTTRGAAMVRLREAMMRHPELVAGEGRACTKQMRALSGKAAIKGGAEAMNLAILPEKGLGVALKISDGSGRAAEAAMAAILILLGVADSRDPVLAEYFYAPITNWRGFETGTMRPAAALQGRTLGRLG